MLWHFAGAVAAHAIPSSARVAHAVATIEHIGKARGAAEVSRLHATVAALLLALPLDKGGYTRLVYSCSDTHKYKPCIQRFYKARTLMSRYTQIQASYSEVYEARKTMSGILQIRASYTKAISYTSRIRGSRMACSVWLPSSIILERRAYTLD